MISCQKIQEKLCAYAEGDLSSEEKKFVQEHLDSCDSCSTALRDLKKTEELSRNLEEVEPPPWMAAKIMARVKTEREKKGIVRKLFFPLHLKVPLEAMATVFIAVLAVYVFRAVEPQMKSMPVPPSVGPSISRQETPKPSPEKPPAATLGGEKKMEGEQEKKDAGIPAPPPTPSSVTQEEPAAAPAKESVGAMMRKEAPSEMKEEMKGGLKAQAPAPLSSSQAALGERDSAARSDERPAVLERKAEMAPAPPPAASAPEPPAGSAPEERRFLERPAVPERRKMMASAPKGKEAPALREQQQRYEVSLFVKDLKGAGLEVKNLLDRSGASNIQSESLEGQELVTAEIRALNINEFMEKLKGVGEIRDKLDAPQVPATSPIAIRIILQTLH